MSPGKIFLLLFCGFCAGLVSYVARDHVSLLLCARVDAPVERSHCLVPFMERLTVRDSAPKAMHTALSLQKNGVIDDCHLLAHTIGKKNLEIHNDPGSALATCAMGCIDGCYHGVMEAYVGSVSAPEPSEWLRVCDSLEGGSVLRRQCVHGVGHGLLQLHHGSLTRAIDSCRAFADDFSSVTCMGGVFMQNIQDATRGDEETFLANLRAACEAVAGDAFLYPICTEAIGTGIMFYTGHDLARTEALCTKLDPSIHEQCIIHARAEMKLHESILGE